MSLLGRLTGASAEGRATPENPSFDLNDPAAWDQFMGGGGKAASGESVTPDRALGLSAWWRGLSLLSQDVGKLPLVTHRVTRSENGADRDPAYTHPAYRLLRWEPNPAQTDLQFKQLVTADSLQHGNGYAYVWRARDGRPMELLRLDPAAVTPMRVAGELWYAFKREPGATPRKLPAADVIHVMGLSVDGLAGLPVWTYAKEALGLGLGGKRFQAKRLAGGVRPAVVLETPHKMAPDKVRQLREGWERMHTGIDNAHRTAILDNALTAKTLSFSAADMQEIEQLHMAAADVANYLGLPVHKVDPIAPGRTAYASLEQENASYLSDGLDYRLCVWERAARAKLLTAGERAAESHAIEFDRSKAVFADLKTLAEYNRTALGGRPWKTPNEARAELGLPPSPEEDANKLLVPLNMGQGGDRKEPTKPAEAVGRSAPDAELLRATADAMRDAATRAAGLVGAAAAEAAGRGDFAGWLAGGFGGCRAALSATVGPAMRGYAAARGEAIDPTAALDDLLADVRLSLRSVAEGTAPADLAAGVESWAAEFGAAWAGAV